MRRREILHGKSVYLFGGKKKDRKKKYRYIEKPRPRLRNAGYLKMC